VDSVINQSEHRPIVCQFKFECGSPAVDNRAPSKGTRVSRPRYVTRWDKANVSDYYKAPYDYLQGIHVEDCFTA